MDLNLQELQKTEFPVPAELENNIAITSLSQLYNWGPAQLDVADVIWLGLLRNRNDRHRVFSLRLLPIWFRGDARDSSSGGFDDRVWHCDQEDGCPDCALV